MLDELLERFDPHYLGHRMRLQADYVARLFGAGEGGFHLENIETLFPLLRTALQLTRLWRRGLDNALSFRVTHNVFTIPHLPQAFAGLRLLHLSDLHIDVDPQHCPHDPFINMGRHIADALQPLDFDICVMTGDFRFYNSGPYDRVCQQLDQLMLELKCELGVYAVLGNHDFIEQVPWMEQSGIRVLVNEAHVLTRNDQQLWIVGLDDPHFYGTHDFDTALANVPAEAIKIMLIHSPEIGEAAAAHGASLYLAGHTHGGQICLPGGFMPYVNAHCPRERVVGRWQVGAMHGYTSAGTGSSGLPVRYNRRPELAIHELQP